MKFVDVQRDEFKRLGVLGIWDDPVPDASPGLRGDDRARSSRRSRAAAHLPRQEAGALVHVHRTALAEAEIEYEEHTSPSIYVRFPVEGDLGAADARLDGRAAAFVIWTTTPWTLPANLAIVANPELRLRRAPGRARRRSELLVVAEGLAESFLAATGIDEPARELDPDPEGRLRALLEDRATAIRSASRARTTPRFRLYFARHVTLEAGTGLVHTAPGHGADDYVIGTSVGLPIYAPVDDAGPLHRRASPSCASAAWRVRGQPDDRRAPGRDRLPAQQAGRDGPPQYPHCWRCKNADHLPRHPAVVRALGDATTRRRCAARRWPRSTARSWIPPWGENRIRGMIENRPDWCCRASGCGACRSRRSTATDCGKELLDADRMDHVAEIFAQRRRRRLVHAAGRASSCRPARAAPSCGSASLEKQDDIVDVWFESGVSWAAVCRGQAGRRRARRSTSTSRAPTSTAAGSTPRC